MIVEDNEFSYNNYARFARWFDSGGFKFVAAAGQRWAGTAGAMPLVIRRNTVRNNYGPWIWADCDCKGVIYEVNLVENNADMGIMHEISFSSIIRGNVLRGNCHDLS